MKKMIVCAVMAGLFTGVASAKELTTSEKDAAIAVPTIVVGGALVTSPWWGLKIAHNYTNNLTQIKRDAYTNLLRNISYNEDGTHIIGENDSGNELYSLFNKGLDRGACCVNVALLRYAEKNKLPLNEKQIHSIIGNDDNSIYPFRNIGTIKTVTVSYNPFKHGVDKINKDVFQKQLNALGLDINKIKTSDTPLNLQDLFDKGGDGDYFLFSENGLLKPFHAEYATKIGNKIVTTDLGIDVSLKMPLPKFKGPYTIDEFIKYNDTVGNKFYSYLQTTFTNLKANKSAIEQDAQNKANQIKSEKLVGEQENASISEVNDPQSDNLLEENEEKASSSDLNLKNFAKNNVEKNEAAEGGDDSDNSTEKADLEDDEFMEDFDFLK